MSDAPVGLPVACYPLKCFTSRSIPLAYTYLHTSVQIISVNTLLLMAPTVNAMINNHTLARNIIDRYHTDDEILDHDQLDLLKRFCEDTSRKETLLADADMTDEPDTRPGTKAADTRGAILLAFALRLMELTSRRCWRRKFRC